MSRTSTNTQGRPRTPRGLERRRLIGLPWMEQRCKRDLVLKGRERKRVPPARIRPSLLDRKACIFQQGAERFLGEFVAALGMDGFKGREFNAKLRGRAVTVLNAFNLIHDYSMAARLRALSIANPSRYPTQTQCVKT
jgi:hypothetical protein